LLGGATRARGDSPTSTVDTGNGLFTDPSVRPVRQGVLRTGHRPNGYRDILEFEAARITSSAPPVRWQRSQPFNLMPPPVLRHKEHKEEDPESAPMVNITVFRPKEGQRHSSRRHLGRVIMFIGLLSAAFASWYLWGTGILTAGEQARLSDQFRERLLATSDVTTLSLGEEATEVAVEIDVPVDWDNPVLAAVNLTPPQLEPMPELPSLIPEAAPSPGEALGRIVIPKAEVDWIVVEGVTPEDLQKGPGHVRGSALPGQVGNTVISGHRTTNGAPFYNLDRLERGDEITVESIIGTHTYAVVEMRTVLPSDTWVATQWEGSWLTLTTCTPRFSSSNRLIVFARLIDGPNAEAIHARFGLPPTIPDV